MADPDSSGLNLQRPKLRLRAITAVVGIAVAVGLIGYSVWTMTLFIFVLAIFASHELFWLFEERGYRPARYLGTASCLGIILLSSLTGTRYQAPFMAGVFVVSCLFLIVRSAPWFPYWDLIELFTRGKVSEPPTGPQIGTISDVGTTFLGVVLTGWLPSYIPLIRQLDYTDLASRVSLPHLGMSLTFMYFGSIFATDVGAYLVGKTLGRHSLIGPLSPKKTVEGALGGILSAMLASVGIGWAFHLELVHCLSLGLLISVVAQISDLTESMIKRDAGKKDSGDILPGHGGVLDRVDSFLLSGVCVYYYLIYVWHLVP